MGPFAAALMQSFGLKRTLVLALLLMSAATAASSFMSQPWHLIVSWGILSGLGSGCVAMVLGATVVNRWFVSHRGLVMGLLTASTATGTLIFLPGLAAIAEAAGWRGVVLTVSACTGALVPLVLWLLPETPGAIGLRPYGATDGHRRSGGSASPCTRRWRSARSAMPCASAISGSCSAPSSSAASPPTASSARI